MATISSGEQLQQHLIALTVGTPVKDADRQCLHRQKFRIPRHQALLDELADYVAVVHVPEEHPAPAVLDVVCRFLLMRYKFKSLFVPLLWAHSQVHR